MRLDLAYSEVASVQRRNKKSLKNKNNYERYTRGKRMTNETNQAETQAETESNRVQSISMQEPAPAASEAAEFETPDPEVPDDGSAEDGGTEGSEAPAYGGDVDVDSEAYQLGEQAYQDQLAEEQYQQLQNSEIASAEVPEF